MAGAVPGQAQQVSIGNRFHTLNDSFFENNTISWSGHYGGITFYWSATPAFPSLNSARPTPLRD